MKYDIAVIGGGPSGMMAAITAAMQGANVVLLEHKERLGAKLLSTGNGKCNFTNQIMHKDCFRSDSGTDFYDVIRQFSNVELIGFMERIGVYHKEKNGYVYPASLQASTISDALRAELARLHVTVLANCTVNKAESGSLFRLHSNLGELLTKKLILCCGSKAAPKTGSDGSGYCLAQSFGHKIILPVPALVQLRCKEGFYKEIAGVRQEARISVYEEQQLLCEDQGELQLTDYGISGIPVFQISRYVKRSIDRKKYPKIVIDFLPDCEKNELQKHLKHLFSHNPKAEASSALNGLLPKKIAVLLLKECGIKPASFCENIDSGKIMRLAGKIKEFTVIPTDTNGFDHAQVCAGGVSLREIHMQTMESKLVNGLYFAGELVDVDGKCGGYNLQWAFSSGYLAGMSAYRSMKTDDKNQSDQM